MRENSLRILASVGLVVGGIFGLAGTFASSASLRGLAWGIDGLALVMASSLLTVFFYRRGSDLVASGFLVFALGQSLILSGAAMDLSASVPAFGAGVGAWAVGLVLISVPRSFPAVVRLLGIAASIPFAVTAVRIFAGAEILPTARPLPSYAFPVLMATFVGWIWALLRPESTQDARLGA